MCLVLSFLTSLHPPSQLKQLRQQLATTQRLLDSYDARGTASNLRELAAAAAHGRGCGRSHGGAILSRVTYGRSRARPSAAAACARCRYASRGGVGVCCWRVAFRYLRRRRLRVVIKS